MKFHTLKVESKYFDALLDQTKKFEVRKNDRGFKINDILELLEFRNGCWTGWMVRSKIIYILDSFPDGLRDEYVVLGLEYLNAYKF